MTRAGSKLGTDAPLPATLAAASLAGSGLLLMAGLWTPLVGAFVAVFELSYLLTSGPDRLVCLLAGTVCAALAMLGPGRWSVDAQLFGWKRIEAPLPRARSNDRRAANRPPARAGTGDPVLPGSQSTLAT